MQLDSHSTRLFCILQSTLSLIKHAQPNPISSVIVAIIHNRENEPCGWDSLLLNLFFLASEKDNLECSPQNKKKKKKKTMRTKQTHALMALNNTKQEKGA